MRLPILITLFVGLAASQSFLEKTDEAFKKWAGFKAIETCVGEQAAKNFLLKMKKAHAKCANQVVPPEVQLETSQTSAKLVRALMNGAEFKEKETLAKLRDALGLPGVGDSGLKNFAFPYVLPVVVPQTKRDEEEDSMMAMMKKLFMKKMVKKLMEKHGDILDDDDVKEEKASRKKREEPEEVTEAVEAAVPLPATVPSSDPYDLGDRLTSKLNEQKTEFALKLSNYSCILQDLKIVNSDNEIQLDQLLEEVKTSGISDPWLLNAFTESKKICYEKSQALPESVLNSCVIGPKWMKIKEFMTCCQESKLRTCMNFDTKQKLEANFGPVEKLTESTGLTERELLVAASRLVFGTLDFD